MWGIVSTQSSKIEGTQTNIEDAFLDKEDLGVEHRDDWVEVHNYIEAMNKAIQKLHDLPFSSRLMRGCAVKQKIMIMEKQTQDLIKKAYFAFNARDIDMALSTMHPNVQWPKAFEGGYVNGHPEIRKYWTRQWTEINPNVEPVEFNERQDGTLEIMVHQIVKDLAGNLMFDGRVKHMYTLQDGLLRRMDIELL